MRDLVEQQDIDEYLALIGLGSPLSATTKEKPWPFPVSQDVMSGENTRVDSDTDSVNTDNPTSVRKFRPSGQRELRKRFIVQGILRRIRESTKEDVATPHAEVGKLV